MTGQSITDSEVQATVTPEISPGEVVIGELAGVDDIGRPLVSFSNMPSPEPMLAVTTQEVTRKHIGRQVALLFAAGNSKQPVIVGLIHNPLSDILENFTLEQSGQETPFPEVNKEYESIPELVAAGKENEVVVDGKRVTIEGAEEITLKCGKASITLTKAGKILIRGTYLSNRSSGVNRILGGSVQIN